MRGSQKVLELFLLSVVFIDAKLPLICNPLFMVPDAFRKVRTYS